MLIDLRRARWFCTTRVPGLVRLPEQIKCVDVPVNLEKGCGYCKQCMGKMKGKVLVGKDGRNLTFAQKRKLCTFSRMGCPQPSCNEHICDACWAEGYTKHSIKKSKNE